MMTRREFPWRAVIVTALVTAAVEGAAFYAWRHGDGPYYRITDGGREAVVEAHLSPLPDGTLRLTVRHEREHWELSLLRMVEGEIALLVAPLDEVRPARGARAAGAAAAIAPSPQPEPRQAPPPSEAPPPAGVAAPVVAIAGVGTIRGTVAFTGVAPEMSPLNPQADAFCGKTPMRDESVLVNPNRTLKNVLVRVRELPGSFSPPLGAATIDQDECMYRPRVQGVVAGQTIAIRNRDQTLHNIHTYKGTTTLFNQVQLAGSPPIDKHLSDGGSVIKFKCDVHPWMTGFVAVNQNPFFAVTGNDGSFALAGVPAGTWEIEAWHERYGVKTERVTVAPGRDVEARFTYDGD